MLLSLYLHFPFCTNKCAYCDFYKELHSSVLESRYFDSLKTETDLAFARLELNEVEIDSIYIGGGTPSLAGSERLAGWLDQVQTLAPMSTNCEFSLECNPESVNREKLEELKQIGVTRPVIGIQSFDKKLLKKLDRRHVTEQSYEAVYLAGALGFESFGVDLIFGLPSQTSKMLSADLDMIVDLDPPHVSFYQLTVEPGTKLERLVEAGKMKLPNNDQISAMYSGGVEKFESAGLNRYEVCSFAKEGHECRHNRGYWTGKDYLGLGPGAHSFVNRKRFAVINDLAEYTRALGDGVWPIVEDKSGEKERRAEAIMLGLRMSEGISSGQFVSRFGVPLEDCLKSEQVKLLTKSGHLVCEEGSYRLSGESFIVADEIIRRLLK